jgi:hypothetical protein
MGAARMLAEGHHPGRVRGWLQRRQGGGGGAPAPYDEESEAGDGFDDDSSDLGDIEGAIDALGEDDEDCGDDAGEGEQIGSLRSKHKKIGKLSDKIVELKAEYAATPKYKVKRRKHIKRLIARAEKHIDKKEAAIERKQAKLARAMGVPVAAVAAAGTAAGFAGGVSASRMFATQRAMDQAAGEASMGMLGASIRSPREGNEMRLGFIDSVSGTQVGRITVPPGVGLRQVPVTMTTPNIAFASFKVVGIDFRLQVNQANGAGGFPLAQLLINMLINTVLVNGDINLIYSPEDVAMGAQVVGGQLSSSRTIPGLRENPILDRTNNATANGIFRQEIDNTTNIEAAYTMALVVQRLRDPSAERRA